MRRVDGHFECTLCSAVLHVARDATPQVMLMTASGGRAERVIVLDGAEVHRCPLGESSTTTRPAAGAPSPSAHVERNGNRVPMLRAPRIVTTFVGRAPAGT